MSKTTIVSSTRLSGGAAVEFSAKLIQDEPTYYQDPTPLYVLGLFGGFVSDLFLGFVTGRQSERQRKK